MGKGGGSSQPTEQTVVQTNLPPYAEPFFKNIMDRAQAQSYQQYVPYQNERTAYFTPGQLQTQQEVMGMQDPTQLYDASNIAEQAARRSLGTSYSPTQFNYDRVRTANIIEPNIQAQQMGAVGDVYAPQLSGFRDVTAPKLSNWAVWWSDGTG